MVLTENAGNFDNVVGGTTHTSGKRSQTDSRGLTDNDPRCRSRSECEKDGDDKTKRGLGEGRSSALSDGASDTEGNEECKVGTGSPEIDVAAAEVGCQNPRKHDEDHLESRGNETESERKVVANTSLLEKVDGLISDEIASEILGGVDTTDDEGAAKVGALEKFEVVRLLLRLLHFDDTTHHGNCLGRIDSGLATQTFNGLGSFLDASLAGQPPRRLGGQEDENGERSGEQPLQRNGDLIRLGL